MPESHASRTRPRDVGAELCDVVAVDRMIDSYVAWREACAEVRSSYERWRSADDSWQRYLFVAHAAALGREEQAARVYQSSVECVTASAETAAPTRPNAVDPAISPRLGTRRG